MGMAEWTLEEAAEDLRIAHAKLKTLPRRMRSGRRRGRRPPTLVTFLSPQECVTMNERPWWRASDEHCGPCREAYVLAPCPGHETLPPPRPIVASGHNLGEAVYPRVLPAFQPTTLTQTVRVAQPSPALALPFSPAPAVSIPVERVQVSPVLTANPQLAFPPPFGKPFQPGMTAPACFTGKASMAFPIGQPVFTHASNGGCSPKLCRHLSSNRLTTSGVAY